MTKIDHESKVAIRLPPEMTAELRTLVPIGYRKHLVIAVFQLILDAIKADGQPALVGILNNEYELQRKANQ